MLLYNNGNEDNPEERKKLRHFPPNVKITMALENGKFMSQILVRQGGDYAPIGQ